MALTNLKAFEKVGGLARRGWLFLQCNKPAVMTGLAMGGALALTGSAAHSAIETYKIRDELIEMDILDKIRAVSTKWVDTVIILLFVEIMIFGANAENARRIATLAGAYSLSEQNLRELREKAEEVVGEKKVREIDHAIAGDRAAKENMREFIYDTGHGTTLYKDLATGRKFYSDRGFIDAVVNELNADLNAHGSASDNAVLYFVTQNDLYRGLGLEEIDGGDLMGWNSFSGDLIALDITPHDLPYNQGVIHYISLCNLAPTYNDEYEYMRDH